MDADVTQQGAGRTRTCSHVNGQVSVVEPWHVVPPATNGGAIEAPWEFKPLALAAEWRARRPNKTAFWLTAVGYGEVGTGHGVARHR
jgi:hypothetical protein